VALNQCVEIAAGLNLFHEGLVRHVNHVLLQAAHMQTSQQSQSPITPVCCEEAGDAYHDVLAERADQVIHHFASLENVEYAR
jgi:hypothetical protein